MFDYCQTRAGKHAVSFLRDWHGALMVDGYGSYGQLFGMVTELGYWAHARRKFFDARKASDSAVAKTAIERIAEFYAIETQLRDLDAAARQRGRQRLLAPKHAALKSWLDDLAPKVLGNSGLDRAIAYTLKRWTALARVGEDGRYPIDNNPAERDPSDCRRSQELVVRRF